MNGSLIVLTGPSGVGKTSVAMRLLDERDNLKKVITCTTRDMRPGEQPDVSYHFFTKEEFEGMIERDEMFEWARVYDQYYGSRKQDIEDMLESGTNVLMVIDVQGAATIKEKHPEAVVIFLQAESLEALLARLKSRDGGKTPDLKKRTELAEQEMAFAEKSDFVSTNRDGELDQTIKEFHKILDGLDANG